MKCGDCALCRLDLRKDVETAEGGNGCEKRAGRRTVTKTYCGHLVALVNENQDACGFFKQRKT